MRPCVPLFFYLLAPAVFAQSMDHSSMSHRAPDPHERLGTVSFPVSCAPASQPAFNRGVALLHNFWYQEARAHLIASPPATLAARWPIGELR